MFLLRGLVLVPSVGPVSFILQVLDPNMCQCLLPVLVFELCVWLSYKFHISFKNSKYAYPASPQTRLSLTAHTLPCDYAFLPCLPVQRIKNKSILSNNFTKESLMTPQPGQLPCRH